MSQRPDGPYYSTPPCVNIQEHMKMYEWRWEKTGYLGRAEKAKEDPYHIVADVLSELGLPIELTDDARDANGLFIDAYFTIRTCDPKTRNIFKAMKETPEFLAVFKARNGYSLQTSEEASSLAEGLQQERYKALIEKAAIKLIGTTLSPIK